MDTSPYLKFLDRARDYLAGHPRLNQLFQVVLIAAVFYAVYRWIMSPAGARVRKRFPALNFWQGRGEVKEFLKTGEYAKAGDKLLALGQWENAAEIFQQGNLFARAGDVYLKMRQPDRAAAMYERAGDFTKAAGLYMDRKQFDRAEACMEKARQPEKMGAMYLARNDLERAAKAFTRAGRHAEAAEILLRLKKTWEAAEAYFRAFEAVKKQITVPTEAPPPEALSLGLQAAKQYEASGNFKRAAGLYLEVGKTGEAAQCYAAAGDPGRAAELWERDNNPGEAVRYWLLAGQVKKAARLEGEKLLQSGAVQQAIEKFQAAEDFIQAAQLYAGEKQPEKAALMYEKGKAFERAGKIYADLGEFDKALAVLARVTEKDPLYRAALSLTGKIHLEKGDTAKAKEYLDRAISGAVRLSDVDVDAIYNLAVAEERTNAQPKALEMLERALVENMVEQPAVEKAEQVRKLLTDRYSKSRMVPIDAAPVGGGGETTAVKSRRYAPIQEIGRGGMGIVYTAKDIALDRIVALKILPAAMKKNERAVQTFLREAKAAASLNHPNIVTIHDTGVQGDDYYIAMEFIDGRTVKEILREKKKLPLAEALEMFRQMLSGVAYAHSKNVIHRDLTTSNIMWTQQRTVKIMDFGLAKVVKELMNEQSIIGGTPSFMSPEQTLGKPIDHRTDIYSMGICLYEMCLGELPFKKGDLGYHHLHTQPPVPKQIDPALPETVSDLILRCMEKDPAKRFQSAAEMQEVLAKVS